MQVTDGSSRRRSIAIDEWAFERGNEVISIFKKQFLFDYDDKTCISNENVAYVKPRERDSHSMISMPLPFANVMEPFSLRFRMTIFSSLIL
jgi:hypothetical protein